MNEPRHAAELRTPTIADAMSQVVDVGERLVSHGVELGVVELRRTLVKAQQLAQLFFGALLLGCTGWVFAMLALLWWLEHLMPRAVAASVLGIVQLVLAGALIANRQRLLRGQE